jgi:hypothetical protein
MCKEFAKLLNNAYSHRQLYSYIFETKKELRSMKDSITAKERYIACGYFFSRVYGLNLNEWQERNLGEFILSGKYKPNSLKSSILRIDGYDQFPDAFERHWKQLGAA